MTNFQINVNSLKLLLLIKVEYNEYYNVVYFNIKTNVVTKKKIKTY